MALARHTDLGSLADEVTRLRSQLHAMQRRRADGAIIPVAEPLAPLFPDGGLRPGHTYSVASSTSLLFALMSEASKSGSWCAVLGVPQLSAQAASGYGIDLERLILVPTPGDAWLRAAGAIAEVAPIVAVHPDRKPHDAEVARLSARLRDRGGVLLIAGDWPGADMTLRLRDGQWSGVGEGSGILRSRTVTVLAEHRHSPRPRKTRVLLPSPSGGIAVMPPQALPRPVLVAPLPQRHLTVVGA